MVLFNQLSFRLYVSKNVVVAFVSAGATTVDVRC